MAAESDYQKLLQATEGDAGLARDLIAIFCHDYPRLLAEAKEALQHNRPDDLHRVAHTFKGNLRFMGADAAAETAIQLDALALSRDLTGATPALIQLKRQLEELEQGLVSSQREAGE